MKAVYAQSHMTFLLLKWHQPTVRVRKSSCPTTGVLYSFPPIKLNASNVSNYNLHSETIWHSYIDFFFLSKWSNWAFNCFVDVQLILANMRQRITVICLLNGHQPDICNYSPPRKKKKTVSEMFVAPIIPTRTTEHNRGYLFLFFFVQSEVSEADCDQ